MKLLIVVHHRLDLWNVPSWFGERLAREFPQLQITLRDSYDGVEDHLRNAEIIYTISLRPEQFAAARNLRWIQAPTAAVHQFLFPELVKSEVVLTNSREVHGPVVAEHVMALIFALAKKIPQAALLQQERVWGQKRMWNEGVPPREIAGAVLGLIGVGSIGRRVAQMASSLGMRVIAVRENVEKGRPEGVEAVFPPSGIDEILSQSDYVVVAAPLIASTERLINSARMAVMKPSACLINVGRGTQVDEAALVQALRTRRIAGAALDVFEREPQVSPELLTMENVVLLPHLGSATQETRVAMGLRALENLKAFFSGAAPRDRVV